jgi:flagellar assembly protein FliH
MAAPRRLIPAADLGRCEAWELPLVGEAAGPQAAGAPDLGRPLTAAQLEALHAQAYQDGFEQGLREGDARGYQEGRAQGEREARELVARLRAVLMTLAAPLEQLDAAVEESLVAIAIGVARHLVRRELRSDPGQVIAVIREAVSVLPISARGVRLHLHPADAALVRERMQVHEGEAGSWHIAEDPTVTRGGCRVATEVSEVDATLEARLAAVVARVMGEEREGERAA